MEDKSTRRPFFLIAIIGALPFLLPLIRGEVFVIRDHYSYFLPMRFFTAAAMRSGQLPLWNPYNASGEPWLANPQTAVFYPPAWIFLVAPFASAYVLFLMLHVILLGWGSWLLFRRRASPGPAMLGAVALMIAGPTLSLLDVGTILASFAWIPLVLYLAARRAERPRAPHWPDAAAMTMCFLGGEPVFAAVAAIAYAAIVLCKARSSSGPGRLSTIVTVGALTFALSAVQLLPFIEWIQGTNRTMTGVKTLPLRDADSDARLSESVSWQRLFLPPPRSSEGEPLMLREFLMLIYAGFLTILGFMAGVVRLVVDRRGNGWIGWLALILIAGVVSSGASLVLQMPIRFPSRMIAIGMIGVVGIAVTGFDWWKPRRQIVWSLLALVAAADVLRYAGPLLKTAPLESLRAPLDPSIGTSSKLFRLPFRASALDDPIPWLFGYQNLYERRFDTGSRNPATPLLYERIFSHATSGRTDLISFLSGGIILCDANLPLREITRLREVRVYANEGALPMASAWTRARSAQSDEEALEKLINRTEAGALHVTPAVASSLALQAPSVTAIPGARFNLNSVEVEMDTRADSVVLVTQRDAPGWHVEVDGLPQENLLANGLFRAVAVSRGAHLVVWRYRPWSFILGCVISAVALVALILQRSLRRSIRPLSPEP